MAKKVYVGVDNPIKLTDAHQYSIDEMISAGYATTDSTWVACSGIADYGVYYDNSIPCILVTPLDDGDGNLYIYSTDYLRTGIGYYVRVDKWALGTLPSPGGGNYALEAWFVQGGVATRYYPGVSGFARIVKKIYLGVEGYKEVEGGLSPWTEYGLSSTQTVYRIANPTHSINSPYYNVRALTGTYTLQSLNDYAMEEGASQEFVTSPPSEGNITEYYYLPGMSNKVLKRSLVSTSITHKVKKAYIGVGGVARPCFGHDPIEYYGTITPLSFARSGPTGVSLGDYGLLGGGSYYVTEKRTYSNVVDVYNKSLTRTTATNLSLPRISGTAISNGNYALFAGGQAATSTGLVSNVDAYNKNLTRTTPSALANGGTNIGSTTIGGYMIIGGRPSNTTYTAQLTTYSSTLARTTNISLSVARAEISGAHVGAYGLLAGGLAKGYVGSSIVDAYTANLVRSTPTAFSLARSGSQGASISAYAIFAGGWSKEDDLTSVVDAYSSSLTRTTATSLSQKVGLSSPGASFPTHALFRVGNWSSAMNVYDSKLIRSIAHNRSNSNGGNGMVVVASKYALLGGGKKFAENTVYDTVDAYVYYPDA